MPRKVKQKVEVNNSDSLQGLMQETYNDSCLQISDVQKAINELSASAAPQDIDDATKIAKEKGGLLKVRDSAIRIKLEIAKLQSDIIKSGGNIEKAVSTRSGGQATADDFASVREMFQNKANNTEIDE